MENLNLLFYKTFYSKLGDNTWFDERKKVTVFEHDIITKSQKLVGSGFYKEDYKPVSDKIAPHKFMLKTSYPGLLAGTGYAHGVDSDDDIKIGFSFDYVTGQPYIPGSSVKGVIRSCFNHPEVIVHFLKDKKLDNKSVRALEKSIFGTQDESSDDGADVFFDAVIRHGDKDGRVMGYDAITPHGKDLTKNPVPIKILKVMPDVVFEFSFRLSDSVIGDEIVTAEEKQALFENLLLTFGIGAKTNVGYGVFVPYSDEEYKAYSYPNPNAMPAMKSSQVVQHKYESSSDSSGKAEFEANKIYEAVVRGGNDKKYFIRIQGKNGKCFIWKNRVNFELKDGDKIKVSFFRVDDYGNYCFNCAGKL